MIETVIPLQMKEHPAAFTCGSPDLKSGDTYNHPKLNQEEINHLNRSITQNEIESSNQESPPKEKSRT
jgi:hypothetical protein